MGALVLAGVPLETVPKLPVQVATLMLASARATNPAVEAFLRLALRAGKAGGDELEDGSIVPEEDMGPDDPDDLDPPEYGQPMSMAEFGQQLRTGF